MKNTHYLSLNEAAKKSERSKGTISKALNNGKLSYISKSAAGYKIDPAELFRVFPPKQEKSSNQFQLETPKNTDKNSVLQAKIELLELKLEKTTEQLDREKEQCDHWRQQAEKVSLILADHRSKEEPAAETPINQNSGAVGRFKGWLLGNTDKK